MFKPTLADRLKRIGSVANQYLARTLPLLRRPGFRRRWTKSWLAWLKTFDGLTPQSRWNIDRHLLRLEQLREQLGEVERRLEQLTTDDASTKRLLALKGVGLITAVTLRAGAPPADIMDGPAITMVVG